MAALTARPLALNGLKATIRTGRAVPCVVVAHADSGKQEEIHFGGQSFSPVEWEVAKAAGNLPAAQPVPVAAGSSPVLFGSLMAFSGVAPELINGRLAMLGVIAALAAEFASGESVLKQISYEPTGIVAAFCLFIAASFVPLLAGVAPSDQSVGPFNAKAEMLNGRAAMLGFAALIIIEAIKGQALL